MTMMMQQWHMTDSSWQYRLFSMNVRQAQKKSLQSQNTQYMLIQKVQNVNFFYFKKCNFKNIGHKYIILSVWVAPEQM